ncbi:MAG TPA: fibronectin type III domain-containing protein [Verrucomicrobiae bacterium]|jgi:hypothetical protein|nr:fibronectin type III domain-containing protein [Verrucomicrobiae bacterium]
MCSVRWCRESIAAKVGLICSIICLLFGSFAVAGASISLTWNPSPATDIAGYFIFCGATSRQYTFCLDAGTNTALTVNGLVVGQTYYFATAAYTSSGAVSPFSNEILNSAPTTSPSASTPSPIFGSTPIDSPASHSLTKKHRRTEKTSLSIPHRMTTTESLDESSRPPAAVPAPEEPADVYNGLFYQTNAAGTPIMTEATVGFLANCVVKTNGHYSARLGCGGNFYSFSGTFNASGDSAAVLNRRDSDLPDLNVALHLEPALGTGRLTGVVSNMDSADPWAAPLAACLATNAFAPETKFFFTCPPATEQSNPPAHCLCELTVASNGIVSLLGWLGDGASVAQTVPIAGDGSFPIYVSLYHQTGLLSGWVNLAGGAPSGSLTWIRPASPSRSRSDPKAFTHVLSFATTPDLSSTTLRLSR